MTKHNFEVFVSQNNPSASHRSNFNSQATQNFCKDQILCSHCGFQGHTIDKCFKLHGFPSGYKSNEPKNFTSTANQVYASSNTNSKTPSLLITQEKYQHLLTLLQSNPTFMPSLSPNSTRTAMTCSVLPTPLSNMASAFFSFLHKLQINILGLST